MEYLLRLGEVVNELMWAKGLVLETKKPLNSILSGGFYCVAWVNTPPLGAQDLSRYPVRLRRGGLH